MSEPPRAQGSAEQASGPAWEASRRSHGTSFTAPVRLEVVDSTNRYLADLAAAGAPEGTSVLAEAQSAGRGRLGRRWVAPAGSSVLCSMLFRPPAPPARWHLCSVLVMLAAREACEEVAGVELSCKWPNDLVTYAGGTAAEAKVAGLLAEVVAGRDPEDPGALVVGIGINCNWPAGWSPTGDPDDPDRAALAAATSLGRAAGRPVDRDAVAARLLAQVSERYRALREGTTGEHALMADYRRRLSTIGRVVRVELGTESFAGTAVDLDDDGHLIVDVGACLRTVTAGDVVHLRSN